MRHDFGFGPALGSKFLGDTPLARGWQDPYKLMDSEDPTGNVLVSCLAQDEVQAQYSGALLTGTNGEIIVEGVKGYGDAFMQGRDSAVQLPQRVWSDVVELQMQAVKALGPVRMEWVHDGHRAWTVQLHIGATVSSGRTIVPGDAKE